MPVSDLHGLSDIAIEIQRIAPRSVLDLGVGFGLYGALCRQIMDGQYGRCSPDRWETRIYGVEVHAAYRNPTWNAYDHVCVGEFAWSLEPIVNGCYDLALMIDSLEHIEPQRGRNLLAELVEAQDRVIVSVPNGRMDQGETFGNPHEAHLWTFHGTEEFEPYNFKLIHQSVCTVVSIEGLK